MPFLPVPPAWVVAGQPTKEELFQYIIDNQDSFNTDVEALKQTSSFDIFDTAISGQINDYNAAEIQRRMPVFKAPVDGRITSVVVTLLESSTSGALQVDLQRSTDNGVSWSNLFTSPVQVAGTAVGSISGSVNFINAAAQEFNQNDLLRVVISATQVGQGTFHVSVYGELN